ncbi:hypothetical protein ACLBKS_00230 [Hylemonella sp. W303a]|uniref:hypothetical protein n=1 Tax=Hylemonella sp. W303a TaxID=3389873 RepID=UPI00396B11A9
MYLLRNIKIVFSMTILLSMLIGLSAHSEETSKKEMSGLDTTRFVVMGEVLIGVHAYFASLNPHVFGGVSALLSPLGMTGSTRDSYLTLAAMESMAIYNMTIDPEKKSKGEIFKENMIGYNLAFAAVFSVSYLLRVSPSEKESFVAFAPAGDGWKLLYRQTF